MIETGERDPKSLLRLYVSGSLSVVLLCLFVTALAFSLNFAKKEKQRSDILQSQLRHSFDFDSRINSEEMWTRSYESINLRISELSNQLGSSSYRTVLADSKGICVFDGASTSSTPCNLPPRFAAQISKFVPTAVIQSMLQFDSESNQYVYMTPLFVGDLLRGYLYASVSDPYNFFRGNGLALGSRIFFPSFLFVVFIWVLWMVVSRRLILKPYLAAMVDLEKKVATGQMAARLAHDIQSPLSALSSLVHGSSCLPSKQRQLLKAAVSRIQSIADDLITRYKNPSLDSQVRFSFLSGIVNSIAAEKIATLGEHSKVEIRKEITSEVLASGVAVSGSDLSRMLSNLLQNAIEATQNLPAPQITVRVRREGHLAKVMIEDNGVGIPDSILHKLRTVGGTYGKPGGLGIGLQNAKEVLVRAGGKLTIESESGKGTTVGLELPLAPSPPWCARKIDYSPGERLVFMDDDESVHLLWKSRTEDIETAFLKDPEEFDPNLYPKETCRYIFDHEIAGTSVTGLDLIRTHRLGERAVLVTSYFNDPRIQAEVARLGATILPKFMIPMVRIGGNDLPRDASTTFTPDLVLIDDDALVHHLWKNESETAGEKLISVFTEAELEELSIPLNTPIYVDKNLAHGANGFHVVERLYLKGYRNLYLTTGESAEKQPPCPYLKGIIGKDYPSQELPFGLTQSLATTEQPTGESFF